MIKQIKKNIKQRYLFLNNETNRLIFKSISHNLTLNKKIRWRISKKFLNTKSLSKSSLTQIKNKCILTGRSRSNYRFLKISRIQLKKLASKGSLPGIFKYSW